MPSINFFSQGTKFELKHPRKTARWISQILEQHGYSAKEINYIFCNDRYLLKINLEYLNHNTLTDIITFDNSENPTEVESDIFISAQRVRENAKLLGIRFDDEMRRVMIHGILHLIGYSDKTSRGKKEMREKESSCLSLY